MSHPEKYASRTVSAFNGHQRVAQGHYTEVIQELKRTLSRGALESVLIFDDATSEPLQIDFGAIDGGDTSPAEAPGSPLRREAREATERTMTALGKSLPAYDRAVQALHSGDRDTFYRIIERWPRGLSAHLKKIARDAFAEPATEK